MMNTAPSSNVINRMGMKPQPIRKPPVKPGIGMSPGMRPMPGPMINTGPSSNPGTGIGYDGSPGSPGPNKMGPMAPPAPDMMTNMPVAAPRMPMINSGDPMGGIQPWGPKFGGMPMNISSPEQPPETQPLWQRYAMLQRRGM